uniref:Succinate dehydogenase/fumarate reductase N-terminal domain-containing protein n=1 Tax=viral metagenome TaxID=1070528 RepID=A0A6C0L129_9ZZZZ|tara:strand:- start:9101 stop:9538 length:438 start_codon:yes stop_codon:yes gene_type:complete
MYLKPLKLHNSFKTFIINGFRNNRFTYTQVVYGVNIDKCDGTSILDGLNYIKKHYECNLLKHLTLPYTKCVSCFSNSDCINCSMNINGKNLLACNTNIKDINEIYPISPCPSTNNEISFENNTYFVNSKYGLFDSEIEYSKRICM